MAKRRREERTASSSNDSFLRTSNETTLGDDATQGLGKIRLVHPPVTTPITPASMISIEAIGSHKHLLSGIGIDWGSGGGCLSIMAARTPGVDRVVGLEISVVNVSVARHNAKLNGVEEKVEFMRSDSYTPFADDDRRSLESLKGRADFLIANPDASEDDDGFGYRRTVLRGARKYLRDGRPGLPEHFVSIRQTEDCRAGTRRLRVFPRGNPGEKRVRPLRSRANLSSELSEGVRERRIQGRIVVRIPQSVTTLSGHECAGFPGVLRTDRPKPPVAVADASLQVPSGSPLILT